MQRRKRDQWKSMLSHLDLGFNVIDAMHGLLLIVITFTIFHSTTIVIRII